MVAVLFLPFSRLAETRLVVEAMLRSPPSRLYIGADGPRPGRDDDMKACAEVRAYLNSIDWPFEVRALHQKENLGCSGAITRHLDWFFDHEDRGVVLEDDCVPHPRFFEFCTTLLDRYADEPRVMSISGHTPFARNPAQSESYWFSIYCLSWGWATWRRAWRMHRPRMEGLDSFLAAARFPGAAADQQTAERWTDRFRLAESDPHYSWFVNWTYACWAAGGLSIMPGANLVRNVGLKHSDKQKSHLSSPGAEMPYGELTWPLVHPESLAADTSRDREFMRAFFHLQARP